MRTATRTRPRLRDHLHCGLRVLSKTDQQVYRITNVWRADRQVQLVGRDGERHTVTYTDLLHNYEAIQPW